MGKMKELQMTIDEYPDLLDSLVAEINSLIEKYPKDKDLFVLLNLINEIQFVRTEQQAPYISVHTYLQISSSIQNGNNQQARKFLIDLLKASYGLPFQHSTQHQSYNSIDFHNKIIKELEEKKTEVTNSIKDETDDEIKRELQEDLLTINNDIKRYKADKILQEEITDAKDTWKKNIEEAFSSLKEHLDPVKSQKDKLTNVYHCFGWLIGGCITVIIIYTIVLCCSFWNIEADITWMKYITRVFPFPIIGGILWFSVVQFNRAQRQMVELSYFIYEADYIEGLLITLNTLSTDVSESARQINRTIETLIGNHISLKDNCSLDEKKIKNLENQDFVPAKVLYKILESLNISVNKNL